MRGHTRQGLILRGFSTHHVLLAQRFDGLLNCRSLKHAQMLIDVSQHIANNLRWNERVHQHKWATEVGQVPLNVREVVLVHRRLDRLTFTSCEVLGRYVGCRRRRRSGQQLINVVNAHLLKRSAPNGHLVPLHVRVLSIRLR